MLFVSEREDIYMIAAKPMTLSGTCTACGRRLDESAAVEYWCDECATKDDVGEWICVRCAKRLARWLYDAAEQASTLRRSGLVQRHGEWVPKETRAPEKTP